MKDLHKVFISAGQDNKICVVTCYDYSFAKILNGTDMDCLLVGDTLGVVMQGNETTLPVTLDDMIYHARSVRRGAPDKLIVVDLPFMTYQTSIEEGMRNAGRVMKESGCDAVKIEGGSAYICELIHRLVDIGIPVMGHIGLTPQSVHVFGGNKIQGREENRAKAILRESLDLQSAGVFSMVLELIPSKLAESITNGLQIPTIGIGAGPATSGQVLVLQDLLGMDANWNPKFLKKFMDLHSSASSAFADYISEVRKGEYPGPGHSR